MPIYEYRCTACRRRSSLFFRSLSAAEQGRSACPHCGSASLEKLVSRFAPIRSEEEALESMADPSRFGDVDESDPRSVARWARRIGQEMGEDLGPEFEQAIDEMEAGDMPSDEEDGAAADDVAGDDLDF